MVDDDDLLIDFYKNLLPRDIPDYDFIFAESLEEAKKSIAGLIGSIKLCVVDGCLPDGFGPSLVDFLRMMGFKGRSILVTGGFGNGAASMSLACLDNIDVLFKKPASLGVLILTIKGLLTN